MITPLAIGEIIEKNEYSKKRGEMHTRYANTFFDESFGRSDFQELNPVLLKRGGALRYLVKYITKTGERLYTAEVFHLKFVRNCHRVT